MKKFLLLTLILLCLCATALAAPNDATLLVPGEDYELQPNAMATDGETLYIAAGDTLYGWRVGMVAPEVLGAGLITAYDRWNVEQSDPDYPAKTRYCLDRLVYTDALYGLNARDGVLFRIAWDAGALAFSDALDMDFSFMTYTEGEQTQMCELMGCAATGGKLFILARDYNYDENSLRFYSFDLATGAGAKLTMDAPYRIAAGADGRLLVACYDESNAWDEETQTNRPMECFLLDPATLQTTPAFTLPGDSAYSTSAFAYDAKADAFYFFQPNRVMKASVGGEAEVAGYLPASYVDAPSACMLAGGIYAVNTNEGVFVRNLDPAYRPEFTLTVYGGGGYEDAHNKAQAAIGNIPVLFTETYYNSVEELAQALASGESEIDVMALDLAYFDVQEMMRKGYCADLSGNADIKALTDKLYPMLQDAVMLDGKRFAVPVGIDASGLYAAPDDVWAEVGLTGKQPKTLVELMAFVTLWAEEYLEECPGYQPLAAENYNTVLFSRLMRQYADHCQATGAALTFDTPLLRELLAAYAAMQPGDLNMHIDWEAPDAEAEWESMWNRQALMLDGYSYVLPNFDDMRITPMPLPLTDDTAAHIPLNVRVLVVNPRSKHLDAAIAYVAAYARSLDQRMLVAMCPDENAPIESANYGQTAENLEERLASAEAYDRYDVSSETIQLHRQLMQYAFVARPSVLYGENSVEFSALNQRYMDGQIDAEQFIREGTQMLRRMLPETN